ncbi:MAG TPA: hypothetical protein VEP89_06905, partial [Draconibacterium sp.]|nr:hypothetical protein [Draconibacterium sp.]
MKRQIIILILLCFGLWGSAKQVVKPDFSWGNSHYYNLDINDTVHFKGVDVVLLNITNNYNKLSVGNDTLELKVSRRSLPVSLYDIRIFVADNRNVKSMASNPVIHGLLKKEALVCLSANDENMLPPDSFVFPVSYNDGFSWNMNEDNHQYSYQYNARSEKDKGFSYEGIGIALTDARGIERHWLVAMESSTVVWIVENNPDQQEQEVCVLLQSNSNPAVFYVYNHLYKNTLEIKQNQKLSTGELIGTCWGDEEWGYLQLAVVKSDTIPDYRNRFTNCINFFPQLHELYFKNVYNFSKSFSRGKVEFAALPATNGNQKNILAFEGYSGMGWIFGKWNVTDKVMFKTRGDIGNARLKKVLFAGSEAQSRNPANYYDFEINVRNGVYRVRAEVGDVELPSWQKIEFEGIQDATYELSAGELKWTSEKVVKVNDGQLTTRIYIDPTNLNVAGI